jgi:hypothetical protein
MTGDLRKDTFLLEEFKALRGEIDHRLESLDKQLYLSAIGIAAIYAWVARPLEGSQPIAIAWWGPAVIAIFGIFRSGLAGWRIYQLGNYIEGIEADFRVHGWESWLRSGKHPGGKRKPPVGYVSAIYMAGWIALLIITVAIALDHPGQP